MTQISKLVFMDAHFHSVNANVMFSNMTETCLGAKKKKVKIRISSNLLTDLIKLSQSDVLMMVQRQKQVKYK